MCLLRVCRAKRVAAANQHVRAGCEDYLFADCELLGLHRTASQTRCNA